MAGRQKASPALSLTLIVPGWQESSLEWVPGRSRREFEIADIGAQPQSEAGADRHQHAVVGGQRRHAEAADDVGRAVEAGEALVDRVGGGQIIDQRHGARAVATPVEAERGTLPIDAQVTGILGVERAFAVAQAGDESSGPFLTEDIAVGQAPLADRLLDDR